MTKSTYFSRWQNGILSLGCAMLLFSCSHLEPFSLESEDVLRSQAPITGVASAPVSTGGITPYIIPGANQGGNRTCAEVYSAYGISLNQEDIDSGKIIVGSSDKIDYNGSFSGSFPSLLNVTTNGTYVSWGITPPTGYCVKYVAAIVKGSDDANIYFYNGMSSDTGLASPLTPSGKPAGLSNLTFCYVFEKCETPPPGDCWKDETAWAAGTRYNANRNGNWATYTSYDGTAKNVTLFAGQSLEAGKVDFSASSMDGEVNITITLNPGWRFAIVDENVKVQDYKDAPSGNVNPGGFDHKETASENPYTITVPFNKFYGVHVDVERECKK
jgi:hypothetical protein